MLPTSTAAAGVPRAQAPRANARRRPSRAVVSVLSPRLHQAILGLAETRPELSAAAPVWRWQSLTVSALLGLVATGAFLDPRTTLGAILLTLAVPFFCVLVLRLAALAVSLPWRSAAALPTRPPARTDAALPTYSILVPLLHEAAVLPRLIQSLSALDYPRDKLDILLILESTDPETIRAVRRTHLPSHIRAVVVPNAGPRTKPKALNYALLETQGEVVVVYDAEDRPEPDQLRRAAAAFAEAACKSGPPLGCVQACLNIYNPHESWLTRQFSIEYSALFDCILPALQHLRLPVPLGGTSNHFPRAVLDATGGWDPFNVTEDADLGIRLARHGYEVAVLPSTTWEEAPPRFAVWKRQRTRWLKGWMQTYLVHMREPRRMLRELGPRGFLGLNVLMGGMLLSALVHPWFFVLAAGDAISGSMFAMPETLWDKGLWWLGLFNLVAGYVSGALIGAVATLRRGRQGLAPFVLMMPVYWLLISAAAYRALWQLASAPYLWEKTDHTAGPAAIEPAAPAGYATPPVMP